METQRIDIEPASIPEWDAEDELAGVLADNAPVAADTATAKDMLEKLSVNLPKALDWTELAGYATGRKLAGIEFPPDAKHYDFYLTGIPLTLIMPENQRLVRLRLELAFTADGERPDALLAYDLFPKTQLDVKTLLTGEASLDVSEALQFGLTASGEGLFAPLAKALGLKLSAPFKWTSTVATVQSSGAMSNPAAWYVVGSAIQAGFSAAVIVRVPKRTKFTVAATLLGDLREWRLLPFPPLVESALQTTRAAKLPNRLKGVAPMPSPPSMDAHDAPTKLIGLILPVLETNEFSQIRLHEHIEELVAAFAPVCADANSHHALLSELERWVRWHRLPGYWLAYLYQLAMQREKSPYFIAGCRLCAEAQISFNEDLALSSLENGYNAALQVRKFAAGGEIDAIVNDLTTRLRDVYGYYRRWYGSPAYQTVNQLTENLYFELTHGQLCSEFPALRKPWPQISPDDLERVIDASAGAGDVYNVVVARRFLGSLYDGKGDLQAAAEQFRRALEAAVPAGLDTEIGHLYRLHGNMLSRIGSPDQATRELRQAVTHEAHPRCAYWRALSARELGDALMRSGPKEIDPHDPPPELGLALQAYRSGLGDFDAHAAAGVIPIARGIEQQMFRSYTDNAIQAAMLSNPGDTLAEIEGLGRRSATDTVAEARAAKIASPDAYAAYRQARAIYGQDLMLFDLGSHADADFAAYLTHIEQNRAKRQTYLKTRLAHTGPVAAAQLSGRNAAQLLALRLPGTVFLVFHVSAHQIVCCLVDAGSGQAATGFAPIDAGEWRDQHEAYRAAVSAARMPPPPPPAAAMTQALDGLLAFYVTTFGGFFDSFLRFIEGKRLVIVPGSQMNDVPLHAMPVVGKRLAEHCDVSYAPSIGLFLQVHAAGPAANGAPLVVHDVLGTPFYAATLRMLAATSPPVRVLADASWDGFEASLAKSPAPDLVFACHGCYDSDDPRKSSLSFTAQGVVPFAKLFAELDLTGCRSVTMAACESGLGRTLLSAEYIGLPLAFLAAGVRYVVGSLWQVNQIASAILVGEYFARVQKGEHTVPGALGEAQRVTMRMTADEVVAWLHAYAPERAAALENGIRAMGPLPYAHPYYWAGFYVTGDL